MRGRPPGPAGGGYVRRINIHPDRAPAGDARRALDTPPSSTPAGHTARPFGDRVPPSAHDTGPTRTRSRCGLVSRASTRRGFGRRVRRHPWDRAATWAPARARTLGAAPAGHGFPGGREGQTQVRVRARWGSDAAARAGTVSGRGTGSGAQVRTRTRASERGSASRGRRSGAVGRAHRRRCGRVPARRRGGVETAPAVGAGVCVPAGVPRRACLSGRRGPARPGPPRRGRRRRPRSARPTTTSTTNRPRPAPPGCSP